MSARHRLTGHERLYGSTAAPGDAMVLDFWRWAFSDLCADHVRDVFAEWMVAKLLGIPLAVRDDRNEYDFVAPNGVRIEVKASAFLQGWPQSKRLSSVVFSGLKSRQYAATPYRADMYVFCVQVEKDPERWDALDLSQWRFYTVTGPEIAQLGQKHLSLGTLRKMCEGMRAGEFRPQAMRLIAALGKVYNAQV